MQPCTKCRIRAEVLSFRKGDRLLTITEGCIADKIVMNNLKYMQGNSSYIGVERSVNTRHICYASLLRIIVNCESNGAISHYSQLCIYILKDKFLVDGDTDIFGFHYRRDRFDEKNDLP